MRGEGGKGTEGESEGGVVPVMHPSLMGYTDDTGQVIQ